MSKIILKLSTGYRLALDEESSVKDLEHLVGVTVGEMRGKSQNLASEKHFSLVHQEFRCLAEQFPREPKVLKRFLIALLEYCVHNEIRQTKPSSP